MRKKNNVYTKGFTIVELLIVIVVIALLAIIAVVAYNGVQARASAVALETTVDQYRKGLVQYATINKAYPRDNGSFCLGEVVDYPEGCYAGTDTDSTVESELKTVLPTLPEVDTACKVMGSDTCRRNLAFIYQSDALLDGSAHPYYIMYFLDQNQNCTLDGRVSGSWANYSSTPPSSGYFERDTTSQVTMCVLAMPDPSDL